MKHHITSRYRWNFISSRCHLTRTRKWPEERNRLIVMMNVSMQNDSHIVAWLITDSPSEPSFYSVLWSSGWIMTMTLGPIWCDGDISCQTTYSPVKWIVFSILTEIPNSADSHLTGDLFFDDRHCVCLVVTDRWSSECFCGLRSLLLFSKVCIVNTTMIGLQLLFEMASVVADEPESIYFACLSYPPAFCAVPLCEGFLLLLSKSLVIQTFYSMIRDAATAGHSEKNRGE